MSAAKISTESISKDKEEEMSSALIAQLLAEDAMAHGNDSYYAEYSNDARGYDPYHAREEQDDSYEDNSEDDFNPKKKTTKASKTKRGRKRKAPPATTTVKDTETTVTTAVESTSSLETTDNNDNTASIQEIKNNSKRPKKVIPEGCNTGAYTELEESRFVEGLELFGRDWTKLQLHVGTRDATSIRSHAQKHFIKMYRDQVPLPAKVLESGVGYTLSGKPLDPNSSAAKPYLNRNGLTTNNTKKSSSFPKEEDAMEDVKPTTTTEVVTATKMNEDAVNKVEKQTEDLRITDEKKEPKKKKTTKTTTPSPSNSNTSYDSQGRTSYSTSRLRRQRDHGSVNYSIISKDDDPLTMIKCEPFIGKPGSNVAGSQPFEITVESNVLLAMDFHAHLMTTEIIGFLAGDWDKESKHMTIREAFPCRSIETGQNDVNVEMDPTSAIETRQKIEERQMKVIGWYHSHPTFIPDPSLVDIENQRNYQMLCRDSHHENMTHEKQTIEPFVGAIVGPYDPALPASASVINWFHVSNEGSNPVPKRLIYELKENESITQDETDRLFELLEIYKDSPEKVIFAEYWRQDASESKLQKMIKSLGLRMPWVQKQLKDHGSINDSFLEKTQSSLKDW